MDSHFYSNENQKCKKENVIKQMSKIQQLLATKPMTLVVSLPENDYDLARLAWENGADAIKVHINVFHNATKGTFGSLNNQLPFLMKLLSNSPVPVGIVIATDPAEAEGVLEEVVSLGFDFVSLYGQHMPLSLCRRRDIANFFAIDDSYALEEVKELINAGLVDILECSITPHDEYGKRISVRDLGRIAAFSKLSVPTVLPTQRLIYPTDLPYLHQCGVKAVMIGAIVTGSNKSAFGQKVKEFRDVVDQLINNV
jgi:hypothetical protein